MTTYSLTDYYYLTLPKGKCFLCLFVHIVNYLNDINPSSFLLYYNAVCIFCEPVVSVPLCVCVCVCSLGAPLFDSSSNFTDPQTLQLLQHSQRMLSNLSTIFHCLLSEAQELTQKGAKFTQTQTECCVSL